MSFVGIHMMPTLIVFLACLPLYPALAAGREPFGHLDIAAFVVTLGAIWLEARADKQLKRYRDSSPQQQEFLRSGLWAWSRHPNYCGEILLWIGVALIALPALSGWSLVTLISPVFVYLLLTRISGIPLLKSRSQAKWGDSPEYQAYKARTPVLWFRPPAGS